MVPYRIGFVKDVILWSSWFWFDFFIDMYFIADLAMSFRTAYLTADGELEYFPGQIARAYVRGWFSIDLMSCKSLLELLQ